MYKNGLKLKVFKKGTSPYCYKIIMFSVLLDNEEPTINIMIGVWASEADLHQQADPVWTQEFGLTGIDGDLDNIVKSAHKFLKDKFADFGSDAVEMVSEVPWPECAICGETTDETHFCPDPCKACGGPMLEEDAMEGWQTCREHRDRDPNYIRPL